MKFADNMTAQYNAAKLKNPLLTLDEFKAGWKSPTITPAIASLEPDTTPPLQGRNLAKEQEAMTKLGVSGARATALMQNPLFAKQVYEMAYSPQELPNVKEYNDINAQDDQRLQLQQKTQQMQQNSPNAMLALEDALRTKNDIGQQALGESELFKKAGLSGNVFNLQQSLSQNLQDMSARYGSFTNALSRVSSAMANEYQGLSSSYKTLTDEYKNQYAQLNETLDKIAQHDEAMSLAEKEAQLQQDTLAFKSKLDNEALRYSTVADMTGGVWIFDKISGGYRKMDPNGAPGTSFSSPSGTSSGTTSSLTPAVRNNNPGNLRLSATQTGTSGGFSTFSSMEDGFNALKADLLAKQTGKSKTGINGDSTLAQMLSVYAPTSDGNNPLAYAAAVAKELGVTPDTKIGTLDNEKLAYAISHHEDPSAYAILTGAAPAPIASADTTHPNLFAGTGTETVTTPPISNVKDVPDQNWTDTQIAQDAQDKGWTTEIRDPKWRANTIMLFRQGLPVPQKKSADQIKADDKVNGVFKFLDSYKTSLDNLPEWQRIPFIGEDINGVMSKIYSENAFVNTAKKGLSKTIGKLIEGSRLSDFDQIFYASIMPNLDQTKEAADGAFEALKMMLTAQLASGMVRNQDMILIPVDQATPEMFNNSGFTPEQ